MTTPWSVKHRSHVRSPSLLFLIALLASSVAAQSSPSTRQDCTGNSAVCSRGLLCLNSSAAAGARRVCRRPKKYEACDRAAPCDDSDPNVALECRPVFDISARAPQPYFPGHSCVQVFGRGRPCDLMYNSCRSGLTCGTTGQSSTNVCFSASAAAALGQDCSRTDCAERLVCKKNSNGSRRCANLIPEGQSCDLKNYDASINPCVQSDGRKTRCISGKCSRALQMGASCTLPDYEGQCDFSPSGGGLSCLKSEAGPLKCLMPTVFRTDPCGDSINIGCEVPGSQCIRGRCGIPNGGQGDVCGQGKSCRPSLRCLSSSISGTGLRCTVLQDAGGSCDPQLNFTRCMDGLRCVSSFNALTCVGQPSRIGGKCVQGKIDCAAGLTCIANKQAERQLSGFEGTCKQVAELGGACNPSKFQICNRTINDLSVNLPQLECVKGKCATKTVGTWGDRCGPGTGATCAPQDTIAKLQCVQNLCVRLNVALGRECSWPNRFGPDNKCASNLLCQAFDQPNAVTKCVRLARDGERCDYNNFTGCQNGNSSCVRGVCTRS